MKEGLNLRNTCSRSVHGKTVIYESRLQHFGFNYNVFQNLYSLVNIPEKSNHSDLKMEILFYIKIYANT